MHMLFRGNSLSTKLMNYCFKTFGHDYLQGLLSPILIDVVQRDQKDTVSYEVDPSRRVLCFLAFGSELLYLSSRPFPAGLRNKRI